MKNSSANIGINGFGRIGRISLRAILKKGLNVVAINDLTDTKTLAHLFKYDSVHREFNGTVEHTPNSIIINGKEIKVFAFKDPADIPWKATGVDIVLESTGVFLDKAGAQKHINAGAKKVVISAPAKDNDIPTVVLGVNEDEILKSNPVILSNASCTTNCAAPMIKIIDDHFEIQDAYVSTIHAYTGDQRLHDAPHKDLRRARAATNSIIPTTTGAAKAINKIFPHLTQLGGAGIRVPVISGSLTDLTCIVKKDTNEKELNEIFKKYAQTSLKGILEYSELPLVSVDIIGNPHSCIVDAELTSVIEKMVKVVGWYDNEAGYSHRIADLLEKIS
ncbi:MAG: type I glyceraldehyde-3-phosphate dehydrogenase [Bacteroidia bacterium]|nr:type I glyceraldehyde-3-phosphate dehydrogenase [Bacteroidia bacterium]